MLSPLIFCRGFCCLWGWHFSDVHVSRTLPGDQEYKPLFLSDLCRCNPIQRKHCIELCDSPGTQSPALYQLFFSGLPGCPALQEWWVLLAWSLMECYSVLEGQYMPSRTLHNFNLMWSHLGSVFPDLQANLWLCFSFMSCNWYSGAVSIHCWSLEYIDFNLLQLCSSHSLLFILCWNPLSVKEKIISVSEFQNDTRHIYPVVFAAGSFTEDC